MPAPAKLIDLIDRFERNLDAYRAGQYNETQVRREFIDPFLKLLGWDVDNEKGYAEAYKEVVHEDAIRVGRSTKAPDYSLRIGGQRKLFVEAKKPSVNLKEEIAPAFQVRRYAWSAKLPLSILTDFEEFAVYDCRPKPNKNDPASHSRVMYLTFREYAARWDELAALFSPEAIRRGSFDQYVQSSKKKRGTAAVDDAFLAEINEWRKELARNIALRNPGISTRQLNFAVQRTIDRLIFLRIAEDRGIERYGRLRDRADGKEVYNQLGDLFRLADQKYNSGLFHFRPEKGRDGESLDEFTLGLTLDDKTLKGIVKRLYYPDSPYQFDVIPADILGQVYEQFLGQVIRLTAGGQAKVEAKPEVKKAGGVFYTPTYIVDYIVQETVGKLVAGKKPGPAGGVSKLRILDPACGSGSFLIGAYQFLLDWHLDAYLAEADKWARRKEPPLYQNDRGEWQLTIAERKRILLNNIYGVDIDPQAVEVTKLSLLLKVMEGETEASLGTQMRLLPERVLPDLSANIKCGNSLIGPDFYDGQLSLGLLDEAEMYRINVFDWAAAFPTIVPWGGFDAVIGNPPYVRQELLGSDAKAYFQRTYETYHGTADLYVYFIEKAMQLLKVDGKFAYIVANKWMRANYGKPLRQWLTQQHIDKIVDFGDLPVFEKATTYPCILQLSKRPSGDTFTAVKVETLAFHDLAQYVQENIYQVNQLALDESIWSLVDLSTQALLNKLKELGTPLQKYVQGNLYYGIKTGLNEAFVIDETVRSELIHADPNSTQIIKPFLAGRDIKRYQVPQSNRFIIFTRRGIDIEQYPAIKEYLSQFKSRLMPRPKNWKGTKWSGRKPGSYQWYEIQDTVDYFGVFDDPKIIIPAIVKNASYTFDDSGFYSNDKTSVIATDDFYLLGLLNSKVLDLVLHSIASTKRGGYFEYKPMYVGQLPIRAIDPSNPADKIIHDQIVQLVTQMLALHKRLAAAQTSHEKTILQRQITTTDRQIDQLVYQLYNLTPAEIAIVENQT